MNTFEPSVGPIRNSRRKIRRNQTLRIDGKVIKFKRLAESRLPLPYEVVAPK